MVETMKETDRYAWVRYNNHATIYKERKFLCVNGPLEGQRLSHGQVYGKGYDAFNSAAGAVESRIWVML